jgi:tripeptide aminopeptidase
MRDKAKDIYRSDGSTILGGDDKCGVAILLAVLKKLRETRAAHGELLFVFSVAEEVSLGGVEHLDQKLYQKLDGGIILDNDELRKLIVAAPTRVSLRLTVRGVGGHAAFPENHINAAKVAARAVSRLASGRLDPETTANLGILWSGTAVNVIPDTGYVEYEIRSHSDQLLDFHLANALTIIEAAVREARAIHREENPPRFKKATVDVDISTDYCRFRVADDAAPVKLLADAFAARGQEFKTQTTNGGSDANVYNARGLPTVIMGCGYREMHSVGEYADFAEMAACGEILWHTLAN